MDRKENLLPFRDPQDVPPVCRCGRCGRELYSIREVCGYCRRFDP